MRTVLKSACPRPHESSWSGATLNGERLRLERDPRQRLISVLIRIDILQCQAHAVCASDNHWKPWYDVVNSIRDTGICIREGLHGSVHVPDRSCIYSVNSGMPDRVYHSIDDTMLSFTWHTIPIDECPVDSMASAHMDSHAVITIERWPQLYYPSKHAVLELQYRHTSGAHSGVILGMQGLAGCVWFGTSPPSSMPSWFRTFCQNAAHSAHTQSADSWCAYTDITHIATLVET